MRTTIYGLDHQAVASTYNNYGGLMVLTKEFDTARDLFESALKIKIKVLIVLRWFFSLYLSCNLIFYL